MELKDYKNAEKVFSFFEEISRIPHASGNTAAIADYLVDFAQKRGLWHMRDGADNVIIRKPATKGYENRPTVIFQGHTDMVADKLADCTKDMEKEGLEIYRDGDFIKAAGTTLGGDDGVAVAYALAILDSNDIEHPEFEAVFTSDEEIGLIGASQLDTSVLHGRTMINIDSDVEGVFTVGCAGGLRTDITLPFKKEQTAKNLYRIKVSGLQGGHSGTEIDKGRANAIKVLVDVIGNADNPLLCDIEGGNADNAIPRTAEATVSLGSTAYTEILMRTVTERYRAAEPDINITLTAVDGEASCFGNTETAQIFKAVKRLPTGVRRMSEEIEGLVETSSNLGIIKTEDGQVTLSVSLRSSKNAEKEKLRLYIRNIAEELNADVKEHGEYPAWEYKPQSHLCDVMCKVYEKSYGRKPEVITIHAGLECGIFSEKIAGLECVSVGPDNFDIHTPQERLSISSTARVWEYLNDVIKEI